MDRDPRFNQLSKDNDSRMNKTEIELRNKLAMNEKNYMKQRGNSKEDLDSLNNSDEGKFKFSLTVIIVFLIIKLDDFSSDNDQEDESDDFKVNDGENKSLDTIHKRRSSISKSSF